jgi:hypothetical protein
MKKNLNSVTICGRIHSFGENGRNMLEKKVSGERSKNPGTEFISGIINVATDEDGMNVVPVRFTYVTGTYGSSGKVNNNFATLAHIIENGKTWVNDGKDAATKVKIDGALDLNEFYVNENGKERLVSAKINSGSFINIVNELPDEAERATFRVDMLITRATHVEADEEKHIDADYTIIGGAAFDFRNAIKPMEFIVKNPQGMNYFEGLGLEEEPLYTKVWGVINCSTSKTTITEEGAFGEPSVRTFEKKVREWIVTNCSRESYAYGEEEVLTAEDVQKAMQDREIYLADIKKRADEFKASNTAPAAPAAAPKAKVGGFNF